MNIRAFTEIRQAHELRDSWLAEPRYGTDVPPYGIADSVLDECADVEETVIVIDRTEEVTPDEALVILALVTRANTIARAAR